MIWKHCGEAVRTWWRHINLKYTYDVLREYIFWAVQMIFIVNVSKNNFDLVRLGLLRGVDVVVARHCKPETT